MLDKIGADSSTSPPYRPQHNGIPERLNRTLIDLARTMIIQSGLKKGIWGEAVTFAAHILNCVEFNEVAGKTPFEIIMKKKPYLGLIQPFGTRCHFYNLDPKKKKLDERSFAGVIVGIDEEGLAYRILIPGTTRVIRTKDVTLTKPAPLFQNTKQLETEKPPEEPSSAGQKTSEQFVPVNTSETPRREEGETPDPSEVTDDDGSRLVLDNEPAGEQVLPTDQSVRRKRKKKDASTGLPDQSEGRTRPKRNVKPPDRLGYGAPQALACASNNDNMTRILGNVTEPRTIHDVYKSPYKQEWITAMADELESIRQNDVWTLVDLPPNKRVLGNRWVFKAKTDPNGQVEKFKARLVVKGYNQRFGEDYNQLYSPVIRFDGIRIILAIAAREGLFLYQYDVKTAFLSAKVEEEIYTNQPDGFDDGSGRVCLLKKALYGLKQAPRAFSKKMADTILSLGFIQSKADPCVFYSKESQPRCIIGVYVDDGILAGANEGVVKSTLKRLGEVFQLTFKPLEFFLGLHIEISKDRREIRVHQSKYVTELLERFQMSDCTTTSTPIDASSKNAFEGEIDNKIPYREICGSLSYLAVATRFDIGYAVGFLSRFLDKPTQSLWRTALRVLRYLKATKTMGIKFTAEKPAELECFSDADFSGDLQTRRSTTGSLLKFSGGIIAYSSHRQGSTTLSSMESELFALTDTTKLAVSLARLLAELSYPLRPLLLVDNLAAACLVKDQQFHKKSKHIDLRYHYVREKLERNEIDIQHCPSALNEADILTKVLPKPQFQRLRALSGGESFHNDSSTSSHPPRHHR